ncbi:hypothetical protein RHS01_04471 [Rhizoctonia solani]|uniref:PIN domain-containing protein n=1 Tax=Rhizoctonia solani TaxID=456999 RepID=A0A8H7IEA8_9AGAM|nr:hypothetical protein RHS01_04471 [Rhizoctonia solani]
MSLTQDDIQNLIESYEAKLSQVGPTAVGSNLVLWSGVSVSFGRLYRATPSLFDADSHGSGVQHPSSRNRVIYEPKSKYHEGDKSPPKISTGFFSWVQPLVHAKEPELLEKIGLDAVAFLRFLRLLRWSFTGVAVVGVLGVGIFDYVYNLKHVPEKERNILSMFTIENIRDEALYVHVAGAYAITFIILGSIWWHWREMVKLRLTWFRSDEYLKSFYARTLMIVQVPKKLQSDPGLESFRTGLGAVLVKYMKGGKLGKKRPTITIGGFLGLGGTKKDAIDFYSNRIANMERAVEEARAQIDTKKPENYGFASMAAVPYAHTVASDVAPKEPQRNDYHSCTKPQGHCEAALASSRTTGWFLIAAVCFFNTIPLLIISALANLASISEYVDFLGQWANSSPTTFSLVSGKACALWILPTDHHAQDFEYQGAITHSRLDRAVVARYFAFLIISQFFIFSLMSVAFQIVTQIQFDIGKHRNIKVILSHLHDVPERIQNTYVVQSSYWLTFFPMRGFLAVFDLAQLLSVVLVFIKTHLFGRTPREIREWTKPPEFDFAVYYSNILFMAAVGLMYAPLAPLVALAAAVVFWLSSLVYKYQLMFVFVSKVESGGRLWNVVMNRLLVGVIFMNLIMTLSDYRTSTRLEVLRLGIHGAPTVLTLLFKLWMRMTFDKQFRHFVPEQDEIARSRVHKQDAKTGRLESRFGHPSLHMELFTPMVHSNMTRLLEQVYQGRMAKEQTRMEEYGGKKMAVSVASNSPRWQNTNSKWTPRSTSATGELDWDARSMTSTAILDDSASIHKSSKPAGYERYMNHGPHQSNGSDIELSRLDSRDNVPLLNRRESSAPPAPPGLYRQDSSVPMMHRQDSQQTAPMMYHQASHNGSEWSLPPSYRGPSRQPSEQNMADKREELSLFSFGYVIGKAKKTRKFATVKRMLNPNDIRLKENQTKQKQKEEKAKEEAVRRLPQTASSLFFQHNTALAPPYRVLIDTNFINFSLQNKLELVQGMMDCLYAKCIPCVTDCVIAELEKLGPKYRIALRVARDPRFERLPCSHEGTYADDCLVQRVTASKCYIVATCDRELRRRVRKLGRTTTDPGSAREVNRTRAVVQSDGRHEHDTLCLAHGAAMQRGRICAVALSTISPTFAVIASVVHGRVFAVEYPQAATTESAGTGSATFRPSPSAPHSPLASSSFGLDDARRRTRSKSAVRPSTRTRPSNSNSNSESSSGSPAPAMLLDPCSRPTTPPPGSPIAAHSAVAPRKHFKLPRLLSIQSELSNPADIELKSEASFQRLLASNADLPGAFHPHPRPRRRDRGRFPEAYLDDDDVVDSDDDDEVMLPKEFPMDDVLDSPARMDVDMVRLVWLSARSEQPVLDEVMEADASSDRCSFSNCQAQARRQIRTVPQKRRALSPPPSTSTSSSSASNSNAQFNLSLPPSTTPRSPITTAAPSPRPIPTSSISSSNLASTSSLAPSAPISIPHAHQAKYPTPTLPPAEGSLALPSSPVPF